jgi:hypothetical protein
MNTWGRLLRRIFLDPRVFLTLAGAGFLVYCLAQPGLLTSYAIRVRNEVLTAGSQFILPLLAPLFQLAVIVAGIAFMFRWAFGSRGGKKK